MKTLAIDRFEGEYGICQDLDTKEIVRCKKNSLPPEAEEGDVLAYRDGSIIVDRELTQKRRAQIQKLVDELWE